MKNENILIEIASNCIKAAKEDQEISLSDELRSQAVIFFSGIEELAKRFSFGNDLSILWDINRLSVSCNHRDWIWNYLSELPGFHFGMPVTIDSSFQHIVLMSKFEKIILGVCEEEKSSVNTVS